MNENQQSLENYEFGCPDGEWTGRLDSMKWGKYQNLALYFTEEGSSRRYSFSVFANNDYRPRDGSVAFRDEEAGGRYQLKTQIGEKMKPVFLSAARLG